MVRVYGSEGQAEVYKAQLKLMRRKKGESLTDLAMEIRRLMVMAFPGPTDRTTEIVTRDVNVKCLITNLYGATYFPTVQWTPDKT